MLSCLVSREFLTDRCFMPATWVCVRTWTGTCNLSVYGTMLQGCIGILLMAQKTILPGKMWTKSDVEELDSESHGWQFILLIFSFFCMHKNDCYKICANCSGFDFNK